MGSIRLPLAVMFVTQLAWCQNPGIVYSETLPVFLQGNTASGYVNTIARDAAGNVYIGGSTESSSLPVTPGAPQTALTGTLCTDPVYNPLLPPTTHPCAEPFLVELDPKGNIVFGTYLNGATGIAVDLSGDIYFTGHVFSSASTANGTVLTKFNPKTGVAYSFPISGVSGGLLMTTDAQGDVYFAGAASGLTATPGALDGGGDIVVGKVNAAGTQLLYAAKFGGTTGIIGDVVASIALDSNGSVYLAGTTSSSDFPVTAGAFRTQPPNRALWAFVTKLNPAGSGLAYSSFLGGSSLETASTIRVDEQGEAYVLGLTESTDFPVTGGALQTANIDIGNTGFMAKFKSDGSGLVFATYLDGAFGFSTGTNPIFSVGAFDIDSAGDVFVTGQSAGGFPITPGAAQSCMAGGNSDIFLAELTPLGALSASTYLGGSAIDWVEDIVTDSDGSVTIAGHTDSLDFPVTMGPEPSGNYFVARLQIADANRPDTPCMTKTLENAASGIQKPIAPGELVTLTGNHFGPDAGVTAKPGADGNFPTELSGVSVLFDGVPAPLLYVQSQQINAQAPFELTGKPSTDVHVEYQGVASPTATIGVQDASPDFFRTQPADQGVVFNQDGSPNSPANPAPVGSVVWILGTGGGSYSPPLPTGAIAPLSPLAYLILTPTVTIDDGVPAQVLYAGSSPTAPSGVFQINFVVPLVATPLPKHTVDITLGTGSTNPLQTVTIAIK